MSGIIKTDISDHFPIAFTLSTYEISKPEDRVQVIYKPFYGEDK